MPLADQQQKESLFLLFPKGSLFALCFESSDFSSRFFVHVYPIDTVCNVIFLLYQ